MEPSKELQSVLVDLLCVLELHNKPNEANRLRRDYRNGRFKVTPPAFRHALALLERYVSTLP